MNLDLIRRAKVNSIMQDDLQRRTITRMAIDFYNYNQESYTLAKIKSRYPDTYTDLQHYIVATDLSRALTRQLAKIFQQDPSIVLDGASDNLAKHFTDLLDGVNLFGSLRVIDRYAETCNQIGIAPIFNPRTGKIKLDFITPDRCIVWQDDVDPTEAVAVAYTIRNKFNTPIAERADVYALWTDDSYRVVTLKTDGTIDTDIEPPQPNPYGRIPIAWFRTDMAIDSFWLDRQFPMVDANLRANIQLTNLDVALDYQSFSTMWTSGMPEGAKLNVGVQRYINIPRDPVTGNVSGSIGYATPSPQLQTVWDIINDNIALAASLMGISAEAIKQGSSFSSGYQLRLSKSDVISYNVEKRSIYREPLRDLVQLIMDCKRLNSNINMPEAADIKIDFSDITIEQNPLEEEQVRSLKISNGTMSRVDAIMLDNQDLSREDAEKEIERIDADNNRFRIGAANIDQGLFDE